MSDVAEYWSPTRVLRGRLPQFPTYPLIPGDLLAHHDDEGWVKHGPGLRIAGFTVDVLADDLQAVRVDWLDPTQYVFVPTLPLTPVDQFGHPRRGEWQWTEPDGWTWIPGWRTRH